MLYTTALHSLLTSTSLEHTLPGERPQPVAQMLLALAAMAATVAFAYRSLLRARRAPTVPRIRLSQSGPRQRQNTQQRLNGHRWRFIQIVSPLGMRVTLCLAPMVKHSNCP